MLMTTTSIVEGKPVSRYLGVVTGEAIIGANVFRDIFASVRDIVGGRSATYEKGLAEARTVAMKEMEQRASELGANAVIGIDLDYEVLGQNNGMLWSRSAAPLSSAEAHPASSTADMRCERGRASPTARAPTRAGT